MTIGPDIKEAITEIGVVISIFKDNGDNTDSIISGEKLLCKVNSQATKPFIREFFLEAQTSFNTESEAGDVVRFDTTDDKYIIMNATPVLFESEVIKHEIVLYKCNVSGEIMRTSGERGQWDDVTMKKIITWETIRSNAYALQTEGIYGNADLPEAPIGAIPDVKHELYIPFSYGIRKLDRWQPVSGEYYRVEAVFHRKYDSVDVAILKDDTR